MRASVNDGPSIDPRLTRHRPTSTSPNRKRGRRVDEDEGEDEDEDEDELMRRLDKVRQRKQASSSSRYASPFGPTNFDAHSDVTPSLQDRSSSPPLLTGTNSRLLLQRLLDGQTEMQQLTQQTADLVQTNTLLSQRLNVLETKLANDIIERYDDDTDRDGNEGDGALGSHGRELVEGLIPSGVHGRGGLAGRSSGRGRKRATLKRAGDPSKCLSWVPKKKRTPAQQSFIRQLASYVGQEMRHLMGIKVGELWPSPEEDERESEDGEKLLNPRFDQTVQHDANVKIINQACLITMKKEEHPESRRTSAEDPPFTIRLLQEVAKTRFRGWASEYKRQGDDVKQAKHNESQSSGRKQLRRSRTLSRRLASVDTFEERYGWNPQPLLIEEHMSDTASGPEDVTIETAKDWKLRLLTLSGQDPSTLKNVDDIPIKEYIRPGWRSDHQTTVFHELDRVHTEQRKQGKRRVKLVVAVPVINAGTVDNTPPFTAPWDLGINRTWVEEHGKINYSEILIESKWGTYGNPSGWADWEYDRSTFAKKDDIDDILPLDKHIADDEVEA